MNNWSEYEEQDAVEINERMDEDALFSYWMQPSTEEHLEIDKAAAMCDVLDEDDYFASEDRALEEIGRKFNDRSFT